MMDVNDAVLQVAERLRTAKRVSILTGAGVSAASGIPTFRGSDGLWRQYQATDLATPEAFARDPGLVWEWYRWRRELIARAEPNAAHHVIASWSQRDAWQVITQNVDDLHVRAGTRDLIRLHGSIWELSCWSRCRRAARPWRDEGVPLPDGLPSCPLCGGLARPAVVWFGESLDRLDVARATAATECDVFIAAGTSAVVYPAASLLGQARQGGAFTVEINPEPTPASSLVDCVVQDGAERACPAIDECLRHLSPMR